MTDSTDKVPNRDAVARRRRMHRRHAKRRLTNVFVAAAVVFTAAVIVTPDAPTRVLAPANPFAGMTAAATSGSLPIQPLWRPAAAVLKRSKAVTTALPLPFGHDAKEGERRESLSRLHRI